MEEKIANSSVCLSTTEPMMESEDAHRRNSKVRPHRGAHLHPWHLPGQVCTQRSAVQVSRRLWTPLSTWYSVVNCLLSTFYVCASSKWARSICGCNTLPRSPRKMSRHHGNAL